jgi:hypothetical protein
MAITDAYATAAAYKTRIGKTDSTLDVQILEDLTSISRYIESRVGRFFTLDASAVNRVYIKPRLSDPTILHIDDLVVITSITIDTDNDGSFADETALVSADYELLPRNAGLGPEVKPFTEILATAVGAQQTWPSGLRIEVSATFGWPAIPQTIINACIDVAAILRIESPRATRRIPEMGSAIEQSKESQDIVMAVVSAYRKESTLFA